MKTFFAIFVGSFGANLLFYSVSYKEFPPDPGFYLSYFDHVLISFGIAIIASFIFLFFYKFSHNSTGPILIWLFSFISQTLGLNANILIPDLGSVGLALATILFAFLANVFLRYLSSRNIKL